tara:strand:- start:1082 stop:1234 length:153 start_codon:yes stop_codon:yes gene_type:complete
MLEPLPPRKAADSTAFDESGSGFFEEAELRPLLKRFSPDGVVTEADLRLR